MGGRGRSEKSRWWSNIVFLFSSIMQIVFWHHFSEERSREYNLHGRCVCWNELLRTWGQNHSWIREGLPGLEPAWNKVQSRNGRSGRGCLVILSEKHLLAIYKDIILCAVFNCCATDIFPDHYTTSDIWKHTLCKHSFYAISQQVCPAWWETHWTKQIKQ